MTSKGFHFPNNKSRLKYMSLINCLNLTLKQTGSWSKMRFIFIGFIFDNQVAAAFRGAGILFFVGRAFCRVRMFVHSDRKRKRSVKGKIIDEEKKEKESKRKKKKEEKEKKSLVDASLVDASLIDSSLVDDSLVDDSLVDDSLVDDSLVDDSLVDDSLVGDVDSLVDVNSLVGINLVDDSETAVESFHPPLAAAKEESLKKYFLDTMSTCIERMYQVGIVEIDRMAHDIHQLLKPKADGPKKYSSKVNSVLFKYFILPHLLECGGSLVHKDKSVIYSINFSDSESLASVFQSLASLGVFNPMERTWNDGSRKFIVVSQKYPTLFRFSESKGHLSVKFYSQGFTTFGLPLNDLYQ
jgi:hypothetical protein